MNFEFVGQAETGVLQTNSLNPREVYLIKDDDDDDDDEIIFIEDEEGKSDHSDIESSTVTERTAANKASSSECLVISASNDDKYICDICNEAFKSRSSCQAHKRQHVLSYMCNVCDFKCSMLTELMAHADVHNSLKYSCEECDFECDDDKEFQRHKITHATSELFACIKCNFQCTNSWGLQMHMYNVHAKPLQCETCKFDCRTLRELKSHKRKCVEIFKCDQCIFRCHSSEELEIHNKSEHSKIVPDDSEMYDFRTDLDSDNDQFILPDISVAAEQSILPDCANDLPDEVSDDDLPVITSVCSTAPVEPQQVLLNLPANFGSQMIMLQNNENDQTISHSSFSYLSDQHVIYGLNNNQQSNQLYYIMQEDFNILMRNPTNANENNGTVYSIVSNSPACSLPEPKSTRQTPKPTVPRTKSASAENRVKRPRNSKVLKTFVIDKTYANSSSDKPVKSSDDTDQPRPCTLGNTVNECLSNSLQKNGKPNFQYEFANFIQSKLPSV